MEKIIVQFNLTHPDARLPKYAYDGDSGMDICAVACVVIHAHGFARIPTGVAACIPSGYELQVRPRSGLSAHGIMAAFGTVDQGYRGEIGVTLYNLTDADYAVRVGERIAQLVLMRVPQAVTVQVERLSTDTARGTDGFGSTGR